MGRWRIYEGTGGRRRRQGTCPGLETASKPPGYKAVLRSGERRHCLPGGMCRYLRYGYLWDCEFCKKKRNRDDRGGSGRSIGHGYGGCTGGKRTAGIRTAESRRGHRVQQGIRKGTDAEIWHPHCRVPGIRTFRGSCGGSGEIALSRCGQGGRTCPGERGDFCFRRRRGRGSSQKHHEGKEIRQGRGTGSDRGAFNRP